MARRKQLLEDIEEVKTWSEESETFNIKGIRLEDESLHFLYDNGQKKQRETFVFHLTDYPDGMNMLFAASSPDPRMMTGRLQKNLREISREYNSKNGIEEDDMEGIEEGEDNDEEGGDMDEEGEGWEEEYATEMAYKDHKDLALEVDNYKAIFGKDSIVTRPMPLLETVDVEMNVVYSDILETGVCAAWGIDSELPIMLRITFSADYFLDAKDEPKIEFYQQRNSKKAFRLRYQLEAVLTKFIKEAWPASSGKKIHTEVYVSPKTKEDKSEGGVSGWLGKVFGKDKGKKDEEWDLGGDPSNDSDISRLMDMGFSLEMARNAISMTSSVEEATNLLLTDPESCKSSKKAKSPAKSPTGASRVDELFKSPDKALSNDHKKVHVTSKFGFLVMVASFLRQRLPSLNNFCVICDQPHVFAHGNMLKPAVCSRELCCFSFQQLGVGADAADDIATGAEVVDLLVCFATVAAKSPRNNVIFEPYPTIFDPRDPKKMILDPKNKDFTKVSQVLSRFPSVEMMSQAKDFTDMKKQMDKAHEHAYSLLQWIITSNRSHVVKMQQDKQIKSMVTPHQYLLLSAPPEKEAKFRKLKEQYGSCFAFHGSSIENWHSILRQGLKNASGTKLQMNGAAYGSGIYISPHAATSFGYCRMYGTNSSTSSNNKFLDSNNMNCIAICEVINHDIKKSGSIWVMPHEDYVVTRFFFVFTGGSTGNAQSCNCETQQFTNEILQAIKAHSYG